VWEQHGPERVAAYVLPLTATAALCYHHMLSAYGCMDVFNDAWIITFYRSHNDSLGVSGCRNLGPINAHCCGDRASMHCQLFRRASASACSPQGSCTATWAEHDHKMRMARGAHCACDNDSGSRSIASAIAAICCSRIVRPLAERVCADLSQPAVSRVPT